MSPVPPLVETFDVTPSSGDLGILTPTGGTAAGVISQPSNPPGPLADVPAWLWALCAAVVGFALLFPVHSDSSGMRRY